MRQKRAKQYRKQMQVMKNTFKFKPPIQVLVDDSTILEATKANYDLIKGLNDIIQTETKFFVSRCCVQHLFDSNDQLAITLAKRMEMRRCNHKETLSSFDCIKSITNVDGENKFRYVVVTQDERLRNSLRNVAGVPLCFLYRSVLVMEPMSTVTKRVVQAVERMKLTQGLNSIDAGKRAHDESENDDDQGQEQAKKKKKIKGVNPLAMKKKQKKPSQPSKEIKKEEENTEFNDGQEQKKKRRRRKHGKSSTTETPNDEETESNQNDAVSEHKPDEAAEALPLHV